MKKMTIFILLLTLLSIILAACGEDDTTTKGTPVTTEGHGAIGGTTGGMTETSVTPESSTVVTTAGVTATAGDLLYPKFADPDDKMSAKPLWFWNTSLDNMTEEKVREIVRESYLKTGYSGFGILPYWLEGYLGERYFELYEAALNEGSKYGMEFSLYDENGFPSYTAGGLLAERYPTLTAKRLDMVETTASGGKTVFLRLPQGAFMGAVAWNQATGEMLDISEFATIVDLGEFDPTSFPKGPVASSTYDETPGYGVENAFDNDKNSRWNAYQHSGSGSYITINFGAKTAIDEIKVTEPAVSELERTEAWSVSYYDETEKTWKKLAVGTTIGRGGKSLTFDEVSAQFVRISFDKVRGDSATIAEIDIFQGKTEVTVPKAEAETTSTAGYSASSLFGSEYAGVFAFDGNTATRWNAEDGKNTNQWIAMDFGKAVTVDGIKVSEFMNRVSAFSVQYKAADGTWKDCYTGTKLGASFSATFTPVTTTAMRLLLKSVVSDTASIFECAFYHGNDKLSIEEDNTNYRGSYLEYTIPEGEWTVMGFVTVKDGHKGMDYLSEEAVAAFIEITYEEYYKRFKEYFDNGTITSAFYDEPCFWPSNANYGVQGARTWTGDFNEYFASIYGDEINPLFYYPALFVDIGEKTTEARDALNRVRTEMFAKNYIGQMDAWCRAHGIKLLGHMNCEDVESPLAYEGDLMYCFKYQEVPSVDVIYSYGMTEDYYKVVSSSAYNWDKALVGVEAYGAMAANLPEKDLYKIAMDLYAKGINVMVPHAVWYDNVNNVVFPPELSYRNPQYVKILKEYNDYVARVQTLLQTGRHVADVAVLYPIDYMESVYSFNGQYNIPSDSNYVKLTEQLSEELRIDFTYLHPSVLDEKCSVKGNTLHLDNQTNYEDYKVIILPAMEAISLSNLQKIADFYDNGGVVIAVGTLPTRGTLQKDDAAVKALVAKLFGKAYSENDKGGKVYAISTVAKLSAAMEDALDCYDVNIEKVSTLGGHLTYIHKVIEGRNVYFFANSSEKATKTTVTLRGEFDGLELWNPNTGKKEDLSVTVKDGTTTFELSMDKVTSLFIVEKVKTK